MNLIVVVSIAAICVLAATVVALGASRGLIGIGSVALTGGLGLLAWFIFEMNAVFWLFPTFLIVDLALIYLLSSSELTQADEEDSKSEAQTAVYNVFWITVIIFLTLLLGQKILSVPLGELTPMSDAFAETYKSLWTGNWYLALFCLMVLCPASFGALLMMRSKK